MFQHHFTQPRSTGPCTTGAAKAQGISTSILGPIPGLRGGFVFGVVSFLPGVLRERRLHGQRLRFHGLFREISLVGVVSIALIAGLIVGSVPAAAQIGGNGGAAGNNSCGGAGDYGVGPGGDGCNGGGGGGGGGPGG